MPSLFYSEMFRPGLPLTSLFIETVVEELSKLPKDQREDRFFSILEESVTRCGLLDGLPSEEQVVDLATRLGERSRGLGGSGAAGAPPDGSGKRFAGYLISWASSLRIDRLCLYAAGYDYRLAEYYYRSLDQQTLVAIANAKLELELERAKVGFEAALFGFGGRYKDTPDENTQVFDLTGDNPGAEVALKNMGF